MSQTSNTVVATDAIIIPVGTNLGNANRTKTPFLGALAFDVGATQMYYGGSTDQWLPFGDGNGNVVGPNSSVDSTLATYNGTSGMIIKDNNTITAIGGQLNGVTGINGIPVASLGNVFGESLSTVNHIVTYQNSSGTGVYDNSTVSLTGGQFVGVTGINGIPIGSFGNVFGESLSTVNHIVTYQNSSGTGVYDNSTVSLTGGQFVGVTGINGIPIGSFGNVFGESLSTVNHIVTYQNNAGTGVYDNSTVSLTGGQFVGVTGINGLPIPSQFGNVIGTGAAVAGDIAVFTFNGPTGIQDIGSSIGADSVIGANVTIAAGTSISGSNTGDLSLTAFGSAPNADGASLSGQALTLQPASASFPGGVTTGTQAFAGLKDFTASGVQLTPTANLSGASGIFGGPSGGGGTTGNGYAYDAVLLNWTINGTQPNTIAAITVCERIGNILFLTLPQIYSQGQGGNWISQPIPSVFRPSATRYVDAVNVNDSAASSGVALGNMSLTSAGVITVGLGLTAATSTGLIMSGPNTFSTGQSTGYGAGVILQTYPISLV